jgi:hypothetical protein
MSLLTQLTELDVLCCLLPAASKLPAQLQRLRLNAQFDDTNSLAPVTRLQLKQLQHLTLRNGFTQPQQLLQLAQLPTLQHLHLWYGDDATVAAATASAWPLLPQLCELEIGEFCSSEHERAAILAGLSAATSLTKLKLDVSVGYFWPLPAVSVAVCASLTRLARLKDLSIVKFNTKKVSCLAPGDAKTLTALSSLTRLVICGAAHGVGPIAATALANNLTQLQLLALVDCDLQLGTAEGLACLNAVGCKLMQLTYLDFSGNPAAGLKQQGLMQLTGLSRLQQLGDCDGVRVTDGVLQGCLAALQRQ